MKVTISRITYEGTEDEIRRVVENSPKTKVNKPESWDEEMNKEISFWNNIWVNSINRIIERG